MRQTVRLHLFWLLLSTMPALAKDDSKVAYVAGTLAIQPNTTGHFESGDERECVITWSRGKQQTRLPYNRIVFAERGSYNPRATLGFVAYNDDKVIEFLTLIYRDEANRTQIVELELKAGSNKLVELIRARARISIHTPPAEVTALASRLASSVESSQREVKVWSTTLSSVRSSAKAVMKTTNGSAIEITAGKTSYRIDYSAIQSLEFGQKVGSRAMTGVLLSVLTQNPWPMMFMKKRVRHLLTVGFLMNGVTQALVIEIPKFRSRALILELELRSGKKVEYESAKVASNVYG